MSNSKSASNHYIAQRLTAVLLIPISIWFIVFIFKISQADSAMEVFRYIKSPFNTITAMIFIITFLYHGFLGIKEIVTDYVHCPTQKKIIMSSLVLFTFVSCVAGVFSIAYIYIKLRLFPF